MKTITMTRTMTEAEIDAEIELAMLACGAGGDGEVKVTLMQHTKLEIERELDELVDMLGNKFVWEEFYDIVQYSAGNPYTYGTPEFEAYDREIERYAHSIYC